MIEAGQHSSLDQEPESSPLNLDASPVEQFRALSQWHLDYARDNPKTFRELNSLLASLGIKNETFQINGRIFKLAQESFTKPQRLRFLDQLAQLAYLPENSPYGATLTLSEPLKTKPTLEETWVAGLEKQKASMLKHGTLAELFSHSINQIKIERDREILQRRLGLSPYEVHTLQEVGDVVGVTRERVRQIVKKQLVKLEKDHLWDDVFREEVKRMFDSFGPLLPVNKLSSLSQWFDGFELSSKSWDVFLEFFSPDVALLNNSTAAWLIPATNLVVLTEIAESLKNLRSKGASNIEIEDALSERLSLYTSNTEFFTEQLFDYVPESRVTDASLVRKFLSETTTAFDPDSYYRINCFDDFAGPHWGPSLSQKLFN